jgi:hypothetical protein
MLRRRGDLGFAEAGAAEFADMIGVEGGGNGSAQAFAVLPGMGQSSPHALAKDFALEGGVLPRTAIRR